MFILLILLCVKACLCFLKLRSLFDYLLGDHMFIHVPHVILKPQLGIQFSLYRHCCGLWKVTKDNYICYARNDTNCGEVNGV